MKMIKNFLVCIIYEFFIIALMFLMIISSLIAICTNRKFYKSPEMIGDYYADIFGDFVKSVDVLEIYLVGEDA